MWKLQAALLLATLPAAVPAASKLEIYCIDVEGGKATLWVSPSGESMLVDTGYAGFNHRDEERILAAAKAAHVKRIDYLVITHYHSDHVGGVPQLTEKMQIRNFFDHGPNSETGQQADVLFGEYARLRDKGTHTVVKPGDTLPVKGLDVRIVSSDGALLTAPLEGAGQQNPDCAGYQAPKPDPSENSHSVGMVVTYGNFRAIDLGDLSADKEIQLVCPQNKLGAASLLMSSHHATDANLEPFVHAIHPDAAVINNGPRKGGSAEAWQRIHDTPGVQDIWQLHYGIAAGKEHNSPDPFIANIDEKCEGLWLKVSVDKDGSFTIFNPRDKFEKTYKK